MQTEISREEAASYLEDGGEITVIVGDSEFNIYPYSESGGYVSEYLGNIVYSDADDVVKKTVYGMADNDTHKVITAKLYANQRGK